MKPQQLLIFVVDEHREGRDTMRALLEPRGFGIIELDGPGSALAELNRANPDLVLIGTDLSSRDGIEFVRDLRNRVPDTPIIVVAAEQGTRQAGEAVRLGVFDFLPKPVNANALFLSISRALEDKRLKEELRLLRGRLNERTSLRVRMGDSDRIQALARLLEKIAPTPFTVLIEGESGAGKEVVAKAIHDMSRVRENQFVAVDCGAIPESLFESELFGHVKGAFTGATADKTGFFEAADNGTLFLDEVCNLPYTSQQKLLRAIEERKIQRLGTTATRTINVRIIAASNRSLERDVENRLFRVDLLHRLKEVAVKVPPLRERIEDVAYLSRRFLDEFHEKLGLPNPGLSPEALRELMAYSWPGNVRELKNVMRQAALTCEEGEPVRPSHLTFLGFAAASTPSASAATHPAPAVAPASEEAGDASQARNLLADNPGASLAEIVGEYSNRLEKSLIEQAIREADGNKAAAARRLRIDYKTLHRKRKQLGIE